MVRKQNPVGDYSKYVQICSKKTRFPKVTFGIPKPLKSPSIWTASQADDYKDYRLDHV